MLEETKAEYQKRSKFRTSKNLRQTLGTSELLKLK